MVRIDIVSIFEAVGQGRNGVVPHRCGHAFDGMGVAENFVYERAAVVGRFKLNKQARHFEDENVDDWRSAMTPSPRLKTPFDGSN